MLTWANTGRYDTLCMFYLLPQVLRASFNMFTGSSSTSIYARFNLSLTASLFVWTSETIFRSNYWHEAPSIFILLRNMNVFTHLFPTRCLNQSQTRRESESPRMSVFFKFQYSQISGHLIMGFLNRSSLIKRLLLTRDEQCAFKESNIEFF